MPTYQYACTACDERLEAVQTFTDPTLTDCPACEGRLRKVFSAVGVVFKGSGFYKNDSRDSGKKKADTAASTSGESGGSGDKGGNKADKGADKAATTTASDKPAAKTESAPAAPKAAPAPAGKTA